MGIWRLSARGGYWADLPTEPAGSQLGKLVSRLSPNRLSGLNGAAVSQRRKWRALKTRLLSGSEALPASACPRRRSTPPVGGPDGGGKPEFQPA